MIKFIKSFRVKLISTLFLIILLTIISLYFIVNQTTYHEFKRYVVRRGQRAQFREYVARSDFNPRFMEYVIKSNINQLTGLRTNLEEYYEKNGNWEGVGSILKQFSSKEDDNNQEENSDEEGSSEEVKDVILVGSDNKIIAASYGTDLAGRKVTGDIVENAFALESDGKRIGTLVSEDLIRVKLDETAQQFLVSVSRKIFYAGITSIAVALLLGWLLFRQLTKPLNELTRATKKVSTGDLDHRVDIDSDDELGRLSESFNQMAQNLRESKEIRQRMISDIAHELRTPLTVLGAKVEAMREGVYEATDEKLREVQEYLTLLNRLVEDLQELTLAEAGELDLDCEPEDISQIVKRVQNNLKNAAGKKKVNLVIDFPDSLPEISLDSDRIYEVLNNLVKNAIRHTKEGGEVRIRVKERENDVMIEVEDTGEGIPEDKIDHVFDRFYRTDSSRSSEGGSGLGLSISKELVQAHGGEISIESEPGKGTVVSFYLPKQDTE